MEEMKVALGECSVVPRGKSIRRFQRGSTDGFDPNRDYVPGVYTVLGSQRVLQYA